MQSLFDGLLISSIVLTISGTTSLALFPKNAGAVLVGLVSGTVSGTVGTLLVNKRQKSQEITEAQLRFILQEEIKDIYELYQSNASANTQDYRINHQSLLPNPQEQDCVDLNDLQTQTISQDLKLIVNNLNQKNISVETDFISHTNDETLNKVVDYEQVCADSTSIEMQALVQELNSPTGKIITWLKQKNIIVEKYYTSSTNDEVLNHVAQVLGKYYNRLANLHKAIKTSSSSKSEFILNLADCESQVIVNGCNQFCKLLVKAGLLSDYHYDSSQKIIKGKLKFNYPGIGGFFDGRWFERYIFQEISEALHKQSIEYQSLRNARLKFPGGERVETDLLFLVNDNLLWIECKAGRGYAQYIPKYSQYKKVFGIDKDRTFLVKLGLAIPETEKLTNSSDITVVNEMQLLEKIGSIS